MIVDSVAQKLQRMLSVRIYNQLAITNLLTEFNYLDLKWLTERQGVVIIKDMKRSHVQNTLNWCILHNVGANDNKDGVRYQDWIVYFTMRLLDPNLE